MQGRTGRLFVALWPDDAVRARLLAWQVQLGRGAHLTPAANLHLTLMFIGAVPNERLPEVMAAIGVDAGAFELELTTLEHWHGGLAVLRAAAAPAELARRRSMIAAALRSRGLPFDTRALKPHVTLARRLPPAPAPTPPHAQAPAAVHWRGAGHVLAVREVAGYRILHRHGEAA